MDLTLSNFCIFKYLLNWWHALAEKWKAEFFEFSSGNLDVKIFAFSESFTADF